MEGAVANSISYNPDVLSSLANLSSDEVFTSPELAKAMLDLVPQELFKDPNAKFFDPAAKTGIFLREIARRLIEGLKEEIPDLQTRLDHIFQNQIYGIAITELTALMSRRSLYCSKYANGPYSVATFDEPEGNIKFERIEHDWDSRGRCTFCGASKEQYDRGEDLESHAYEFIHVKNLKELENMKFDLIVSNPPYHLETKGAGRQSKPIYHLFVEQAKKLRPRYLTMIIPSRWFAGGMGLDTFREDMMNDKHIRVLVYYLNGKDCFPLSSVGGVNYFLWDRDNPGQCKFTDIIQGRENTMIRDLNTHPVLVRFNEGISILNKINFENDFQSIQGLISSLMPFGLGTDYRGRKEKKLGDYTLHASTGISYVSPEEVPRGQEYINCYNILISKTSAEHAGEPSSQGDFKVLTSSMKVIGPGEICTHSYFVIGQFEKLKNAENLLSYLNTKFVRFLLLLSISSINLSKLVFTFVPFQDFSKPWTDKELYEKYNLEEHEIAFIESMIKPI